MLFHFETTSAIAAANPGTGREYGDSMDWQLAQDYRPTILVVGFRQLSQLISVVSPEFSTRARIEILDFIFEKDVTINNILQYQHADVVVSAGSNSEYLKQRIDLPVISLLVSDRDVIKALNTASALENRVMVISNGDHSDMLTIMQPLLSARIDLARYETADEARTLVYLAVKKGYPLIIGSSYVCSLAEQQNVKSLLLYSSESCRTLLEEAVTVGIAEHTCKLVRRAKQAGLANNSVATLLTAPSGELLAYDRSQLELLGMIDSNKISQAATQIHLALQDIEREDHRSSISVNGHACLARRFPCCPEHPEQGFIYTLRADTGTEDPGESDRSATGHIRPDDGKLQYRSESMARVDRLISSYAQSRGTVLITGESGTGKELVAREIHQRSHFRNGEFVAVNCGAIPEELFESELFGYADGAFTASRKGGRTGLLLAAHNGVFFLDEISELPLSQQAKILRIIQERRLRPLGTNKEVLLNVKFVCASNRDLAQLVADGRFRQDLYYRLNVLNLQIPPLHQRRQDILPIAEWLLVTQAGDYGIDIPTEAILETLGETLQAYNWPGNVRELANVTERIVTHLISNDNAADLRGWLPHIAPELYANMSAGPAGETASTKMKSQTPIREVEMEMILAALQRFDGNRARAAKHLGISATTLWRRLKHVNE
jgi:propionate catabolism operon transcriptional regulator